MAGTPESGSEFTQPDGSKDSMGLDRDSQLREMEDRRHLAEDKMLEAKAQDGENNGPGHDSARQREVAWGYLMRRYREFNGMGDE